MERWLPIDEFPGYSISDQGRVRNDATKRVMVMVRNQGGVSMHLDGDRTNCAASNLVWRPRWYVQKYQQQFENYRQPYVNRKVQDVSTGAIYANSWDAAISNGLREFEVAKSVYELTTAWPTYQSFRLAE
jgi:hypothetical protein